MAQSAVGAIRAGCQMLSEGKQFIDDAKSEMEGIVGQVKETYETVTGLWGWVTGLFGGTKQTEGAAPAAPVAAAKASKPVAKKAKPEPELSYEEFQARAVHEICENLKVYFEAIRQLKIHCRELEEEALTTEKVADSAIDRIEIQWQMKQLSAQLKQSMIYGTPESLGLGAMYAEFLAKQDEIVEEQEVARELKLKKERDTAWQHEHRNEILIAKLSYVAVAAILMIEVIGLYLAL
jgi:hypothetical protein